jgi:hypothetical protein
MFQFQSWAPTSEKVSDNRHRQTTANIRQPTPDNQEHTTTTERDIRQSTASNEQPTLDIEQQTTITDNKLPWTQQTTDTLLVQTSVADPWQFGIFVTDLQDDN